MANELDANIVVDGQKVIATLAQEGEVVKDGGAIDATSVIQTDSGLQKVVKTYSYGGGGGGSSNYNDLSNKPKVNGVTLSGNKTGLDLQLAVVLESSSNTTVNGYQVPTLTSAQITQAYNGLVAGKQVVVTDATGLMHFTVNQADMVSDEPIISIEYFDIMELTYLTDGTIEFRSHNNQITLTQAQYDALTTYADHCDYRIIED